MARSLQENEIQEWMLRRLAQILDVSPDQIDVNARLDHYGLESVEAITVASELSDWLDRRLSPTLLWDHPTIARLACHIAEMPGEETP
jgi:acyl carrier protein